VTHMEFQPVQVVDADGVTHDIVAQRVILLTSSGEELLVVRDKLSGRLVLSTTSGAHLMVFPIAANKVEIGAAHHPDMASFGGHEPRRDAIPAPVQTYKLGQLRFYRVEVHPDIGFNPWESSTDADLLRYDGMFAFRGMNGMNIVLAPMIVVPATDIYRSETIRNGKATLDRWRSHGIKLVDLAPADVPRNLRSIEHEKWFGFVHPEGDPLKPLVPMTLADVLAGKGGRP
jgi:hypothetical protein